MSPESCRIGPIYFPAGWRITIIFNLALVSLGLIHFAYIISFIYVILRRTLVTVRWFAGSSQAIGWTDRVFASVE